MRSDELRVKLKSFSDKFINKYTITGVCIIAAALLIWAVISLIGYYSVPEDNPNNSYIANSGFAVEYNDRIISSLGPISTPGIDNSKVDLGIISTDANGLDMKVICTDYASNINCDGNYIYYVNNSDNGSVYRIKPDGTGREKVFEQQVLSMIYDDGFLYVFETESKRISKISTADFSEKVLVENCMSTTLTIAGNNVYFFNIDGDKRKIASVSKDGGSIKHYGVVGSAYGLTAYKGYLYYIDGETVTLHKSKIGSVKDKKISDEMIYKFFIVDDTIYYLSNISASEGGAYKMDMAGKNSEKICSGSMRTISVAHGKLFTISLGYESEPFLYIIDSRNGVILKTYDMTDEEKRALELYKDKTAE